uniref:Gag-like polypeptide n=1 Tax=Drosophila melanogaster TaxID=7227 RepID=V9H1K0_DROME|nr:gag-like polyprotein - fruit fly (Drosophila melanogaster) transposon 17B3 [Drosophila melanogaster]CAA54341.1 gag-like polypeptide [Drosophila melanogaster]
MSTSDNLFSDDEVLAISSSPEQRSSPFYLNISPMSHGSDNSQINTIIINQKQLSSSQANKSPKNSSEAAIKIVNSLSHKGKEKTNTNNAQKDPLSLTNTVAATVGAKSSITKGKLPSPPSTSHTFKGKLLPKMTHTNAAAATNTDAELKSAKLSDALGNFPSLSYSDGSINLSSSTKIGCNKISPLPYAHTNTSKATNISVESRSKCSALVNSNASSKKANASDSGEILSSQIQIDKHKQEERPSTTLNAFWSIFNPKPDVSKLSLNRKLTNRNANIGKRSISPHKRNTSLRHSAQRDLNSKPNSSAMPTVGNLSATRTLSRPAAKRDLFKSPSKSPDEQPMSFSEVVAGTDTNFVASPDPTPQSKTPGKRTNDELDSSRFKTPNKRICATTNFETPNIFPPLITPVFKSKAAQSVYEESKARNGPPRQPLPCSINASARSAARHPV